MADGEGLEMRNTNSVICTLACIAKYLAHIGLFTCVRKKKPEGQTEGRWEGRNEGGRKGRREGRTEEKEGRERKKFRYLVTHFDDSCPPALHGEEIWHLLMRTRLGSVEKRDEEEAL